MLQTRSLRRAPALVLALVLALVTPAHALDPALAQILARHNIAAGQASYLLFDSATGAARDGHNPDLPTIPASVAKLVPAFAALALLGPDHRFVTDLAVTGEIDRAGTLHGDVILRGGGDPALLNEHLGDLAEGLRRAGVRRVAGRFLYDAGLYPELERISPRFADDATYNYAISALTLNFNRLSATWRSDPAGRRNFTLLAASDAVKLPVAWVRMDGPPPPERVQFAYSPLAGGERWGVNPTLRPNGHEWLPVRRPALSAGQVFRLLAQQGGISLPAPQPGTIPINARPIARIDSAPLVRHVEDLLRFSNNLTAELVGLAAARHLSGRPQPLAEAAASVQIWLQKTLPQIDWRGFRLVNFSGLDPGTRVTARQIAGLLIAADRGAAGVAGFRDLLPAKSRIDRAMAQNGDKSEPVKAGAGRGRKAPSPPPPIGFVRAKSGTLAFVKGLAGFLTRPDGGEMGFVLLFADQAGRAAMDGDPGPPPTLTPANGQNWARRAGAAEIDALRHWALGGDATSR